MSKDIKQLSTLKINPEMISRGTGQKINLSEATVYDFMPRIVGNRFREITPLRNAVHLYQEVSGPNLACEQAYTLLAIQELKEGNLDPALEAYKNALYYATHFLKGMTLMQNVALVTVEETQRLDFSSFQPLEEDLIQIVAAQKAVFDITAYVAFLDEVRALEKSASDLTGRYFRLMSEERDNPELGKELRDLSLRMRRYSDAALISEKLGEADAEQEYRELSKNEPKTNPKLNQILKPLLDQYDY